MIEKRTVLLLFFLLMLFNRKTVCSQNLVPNGSFEAGASSPTISTDDFGSNCSPWEAAQFKVGLSDGLGNHGCGKHPWYNGDWVSPTTDQNFQDIIKCTNPKYPSNEFVRLKSATVSYAWYCFKHCRHHSGIRVALAKNGTAYSLIKGATYTMRIKLRTGTSSTAEFPGTINNNLRVHFAKFGLHWNEDPDAPGSTNRRLSDALDFAISPPLYDPCQWYSFQKTFTVPNSKCDGNGGCDYLSNMILFLDDANNTSYVGDLSIDDVELYEGGCGGNWSVENWNYYTYEIPYEFQVITAGHDAGIPSNAGDVIVKSTANVTYKASQEVALLPGFGVEAGGIFHAYIAPCGLDCFPPTANAGTDAISCGTQTVQLGFPSSEFEVTYSWSANPSSALVYLSNTTISNPVFTPPTSGNGRIVYTLKATNACGQSVTDNVIITYEANPNNSPTISVNNINYSDLIEFDANFSSHTEQLIIEVWTAGGSLVNTYYYAGTDFNGNTYHWKIPAGLDPCQDYKIIVKTKNLCSSVLSTPYTITWVRNKNLSFISVPNVLSPSQPNWCFTFTGGTHYDLTIYNRQGTPIYIGSGIITPPSACVWSGQCNQPACSQSTVTTDAVYYPLLTITGCNGNTAHYSGFINNYREMNALTDTTQSVIAANNASSNQIGNNQIKAEIYPNPNTGSFTIKLTGLSDQKINNKIIIYDVMGNIIQKTEMLNESIIIDISSQAKGMYFIKIENEQGIKVEKIIYQ